MKRMAPIEIEQDYSLFCLRSCHQDHPWFAATGEQKPLLSKETGADGAYATPRGHRMGSGRPTPWSDLSDRVAEWHSSGACRLDAEQFLPQRPFWLTLNEHDGGDRLHPTRTIAVIPRRRLTGFATTSNRAACAGAS